MTTIFGSRVPFIPFARLYTAAITPEGSQIWVAGFGSDLISLISTSTNSQVAYIRTGGVHRGLGFTPTGSHAYTTTNPSVGSGWVSVYETSAPYAEVQRIEGVGIADLAVGDTPRGPRAYVAGAGGVSVIDAAKHTYLETVAIEGIPLFVTMSPDGKRAYAAGGGPSVPGTVWVIDTDINELVGEVAVGNFRWGLAVAKTPNGERLYVANANSHTLSVIEPISLTVEKTIGLPVGSNPRGLTMLPDGSEVYVALTGSNSVAIITTTNNSVDDVISLGPSGVEPHDIVIRPALILPNQPPKANPGGPYSGNEGEAVTFDGTGSSDPDGDALTYDWAFGDGGTATSTATPSHTYADNGLYTVTLTVTDPDGETSTVGTEVKVVNVVPTVDTGPDATISQGDKFNLSATFSDPGVDDAPWRFLIQWGDASVDNGKTFDQNAPVVGTHQYFIAGEHTVLVAVFDKDEGKGVDGLTLTVNPVPVPVSALETTIGETKTEEENQRGKGKKALKDATTYYEMALSALKKDPPDLLAAAIAIDLGNGSLDVAVKEGVLSPGTATPIMLSATKKAARILSVLSIGDASASGGDLVKIEEAIAKFRKAEELLSQAEQLDISGPA